MILDELGIEKISQWALENYIQLLLDKNIKSK